MNRAFSQKYNLPLWRTLFYCPVLLTLLACVPELGLAQNASALPSQLKLYPVQGTNVNELMDDIALKSISGTGAFGYTKLNTQLQWESIQKRNGECSLGTVDLSYTVTIYMPEWTNRSEAKSCLQNNWNAVWRNIRDHEETHKELYNKLHIPSIKTRLKTIQKQASCERLSEAVNAEMNRILEENNALHDAFHNANTPPVLRDC